MNFSLKVLINVGSFMWVSSVYQYSLVFLTVELTFGKKF